MPLCRKYIINFVDVTVYEVLLLFRPPENFSIPMVLIQDVDAIPFLQFIFHQQKYVDVSGALFGITKTKEIIPSPKVCFKFSYHMILLYLLYYIYGFSHIPIQFSSFVTRMQMKSVYQQIIYLVETKTLKVYLDRYPIIRSFVF